MSTAERARDAFDRRQPLDVRCHELAHWLEPLSTHVARAGWLRAIETWPRLRAV